MVWSMIAFLLQCFNSISGISVARCAGLQLFTQVVLCALVEIDKEFKREFNIHLCDNIQNTVSVVL